MAASLWRQCVEALEGKLPAKAYGTYILPLQADFDGEVLRLLAPNTLVQEAVLHNYLSQIQRVAAELAGDDDLEVMIEVGSQYKRARKPDSGGARDAPASFVSRLDQRYTFASFVPGKSNSVARAAAERVAEHPGQSYNPLLIYGGVGLGKTHLMHAIGNRLLERAPNSRVIYLSSERFVNEMVGAIRHGRMDEFKRTYRSADALLIDDIQFFAGKTQSQEEFFHTFNALLEGKQQIVLTCDRFPKELDQLDDRLKSRFSWGLTVSVEPPELETRVAILMSKAEGAHAALPEEVAFFIAKRVKSNVRDLESALHRLVAHAQFTGHAVSIDFAKQTLHDMLASHDRQITLENIIRTVAEYYKVRVTDLLSARRNRSLARPRQLAMALAKELTNHSLPEIGEAFGGRDHTTVLHAYRKIQELREADAHMSEDYSNLFRTLSH